MLKFILTPLLLMLTYLSFSQQIKVVDAKNNQPIPHAHVCFDAIGIDNKTYEITNTEGEIIYEFSYDSQVAISFMGYNTYVGKIVPNKDYLIKLEPSTVSVNEVVVTGQLSPQTADKSIYNIQVINSLQIQNKAATNLGELLINEPNINVRQGGILGTTLSMQGLSGEHIKILVDGVPIIGRQDGNIDLSQINMNNVDHIEIVEGPMSVAYGSNALAGAINIITKQNNRPKFTGGLNAYLESVGTFNTDGSFTSNIKNHLINVNFGHNYFNGYSFRQGERAYDFNPKRQYFGTFDYAYTGKKMNIQITQDAFNEELRDYYSIDSLYYEPASDSTANPMVNDQYHYTFRANTKANFNYKFSDKSFLDIVAAYSNYQKKKITYKKNLNTLDQDIFPDNSLHDTTTFNTIMSRGSFTSSAGKLNYQLGYDFNFETGTGKRLTETQQINDYAAFTSLKYDILYNLQIQAGLRAMHNTKFKAPVVYSFNVKYDPGNFNLRGSYGTGFRSPSLKELYLDFVDVSHNVQGNPNLEPEYSQNLSLSALYKSEVKQHNTTLSLKFYHNRIDNKIDLIVDPDSDTEAEYGNIKGTYKTLGTQFDFTYRLHPRLKINAGFNYLGYSQLTDLDNYLFTTDAVTSFNYTNLKYQFRINFYLKHNGKRSQYYLLDEDDPNSITERYIDNYQLMDLTFGKPFYNDKLDLTFGIKNLLDYKTVNSIGAGGGTHSGGAGSSLIGWGRAYFVKLTFNFTQF